MQHTVDTLMSLAYAYADKYADSYEVEQDNHGMRTSREALRTALTEALAQPVQEPLTDEQIQGIYRRTYNMGHHGRDFENLFARGIESAHHIGGDK